MGTITAVDIVAPGPGATSQMMLLVSVIGFAIWGTSRVGRLKKLEMAKKPHVFTGDTLWFD